MYLLTFVIISTVFAKDEYYQKPNSKGPTAANIGVQCLEEIGTTFFYTIENYTRPKRLILTHMSDMISPAAEIQEIYLKNRNNRITCTNCTEQRLQLSIVSDRSQVPPPNRVPLEAIVPNDFYVIIADEVQRLFDFFSLYLSKTVTWNPGAEFLVLYNSDDNETIADDVASEIFEFVASNFYVTNIMMLIATDMETYQVIQLNYYSKIACRTVKLQKFKPCYKGMVGHAEKLNIKSYQVFSRVKTKFKNCTFNLCCSIAAPFVEKNCYSGIELNLIEVIQKKMGFSLNQSCTDEHRGILNDTEWTGLLKRLIDGECDFILGGFYPDNEVMTSFWGTDPYFRDSYTWYAQKAPLQPAWKGLISIFEPFTWLMFAFVLLVTWITWFTLGRLHRENEVHSSLSLTAINNLAVALGVSVNERPTLPPLRIFFIGLVLFGLNVTSIFTSDLIGVFRNPKYDDQVSSIAEVMERNIPFGGAKESRDWFENDEDEEIFERYNDSDLFEPTNNLHRVAQGQCVILANEKFVLQSKWSNDIYPFRMPVFLSPVQMILNRGFPLHFPFNKLIRRIRDYGIFNKINNDFFFNNTMLKYIKAIAQDRNVVKPKTIILRVEHLGGAFAILLIGLGFSIIVFILEIITSFYISPYLRTLYEWHTHRRLWGDSSRTAVKKYLRRSPKVAAAAALTTRGIRFTPIRRRNVHSRRDIV